MSTEYQQSRKGFWHEGDEKATSEGIALEAWARAAHFALVETAETYHAVISESALAERVQVDSEIRTSRPPVKWLAKVLSPLAQVHRLSGEPPLTALVVDDQRGWVGERYDDVLRAADHLPIVDPVSRERHAARARLECYRWAGSTPDDGGEPAAVPAPPGRRRTPTGAAAPTSARPPRAPREPTVATPPRIAPADRPVTVCPTCFMAIPATGVCDTCD